MFSVIIPLYNKADYIEKAIKSVLNQTFQEFELIIVNDGSTDNGFEIVNNLIVSRTPSVLVINQENQGVSVARNNGLKIAQFKYIAFLDADDWWESTYLQELKGLIEEYPQAGIYGSGYYLVKKGHKHVAQIGIESNFQKGLINYCQVYSKTLCMPLWTGATVIKKSIYISEDGFKPALKLGEDFDLWIRVALKYPVAILNKPLANYNQDVELSGRAIGKKLYEPSEHMLFTDYGVLNENPDFRCLYENLAVYGLLPYYLANNNKNKKEAAAILSSINWYNQEFKYRLYYRILPKNIIRTWFLFLKIGSQIKNKVFR